MGQTRGRARAAGGARRGTAAAGLLVGVAVLGAGVAGALRLERGAHARGLFGAGVLSCVAAPRRDAGKGTVPESLNGRERGPPAADRPGGGRAGGQMDPGRGSPKFPRYQAKRLLHGRPYPLDPPRGVVLSRVRPPAARLRCEWRLEKRNAR